MPVRQYPIPPKYFSLPLNLMRMGIVARHSLPRAEGVGATLAHVLAIDGLGREVVVALHHDGRVAFGYDSTVPDSFHRVDSFGRARHPSGGGTTARRGQ